jgi:hypothetical protein
MADETDTKQIWKSISSAIGAEVREATTIIGISGQDHPVQAVAVDDKTSRVVIFPTEPSPRIASLMQSDVQATIPDAHVLVARPVLFNLSEIARRLSGQLGDLDIKAIGIMLEEAKTSQDAHKRSNEILEVKFGPVLKPFFGTASRIPIPLSVLLMDLIGQLSNLGWSPLQRSPAPEGAASLEALWNILFSARLDSAATDRQLGICPIPLYDFSEADLAAFLSGSDIDEIQLRLKDLGIYQYFFPAPDHLLLGLTDNKIEKDGSLITAAEEAPSHGHPFGATELFQGPRTLREMLEELTDIGYVAETEVGWEITENGRTMRQTVKARPREGLISKLSKIISVKVDLSTKDLLK